MKPPRLEGRMGEGGRADGSMEWLYGGGARSDMALPILKDSSPRGSAGRRYKLGEQSAVITAPR